VLPEARARRERLFERRRLLGGLRLEGSAREAVEYGLIDEVVSTRKTAGIAATGGQAGR
jgi:hypothetical protein